MAAGIQKKLRRLHPSLSASKSIRYVQRDLVPQKGHLRSDYNPNGIGKSPGANPLDQATHSFVAIHVFITKSHPFSGLSLRKYMCCFHVHIGHPPLPWCTCPSSVIHVAPYVPLLTLAMKRSLPMCWMQKSGQ